MTKKIRLLNPDGSLHGMYAEFSCEKFTNVAIGTKRYSYDELTNLGFKIEEVEKPRAVCWLPDSEHSRNAYAQPLQGPSIHFVELKPGEKILSREDIEKAWHFGKHYEGHLEDLLKELGF